QDHPDKIRAPLPARNFQLSYPKSVAQTKASRDSKSTQNINWPPWATLYSDAEQLLRYSNRKTDNPVPPHAPQGFPADPPPAGPSHYPAIVAKTARATSAAAAPESAAHRR